MEAVERRRADVWLDSPPVGGEKDTAVVAVSPPLWQFGEHHLEARGGGGCGLPLLPVSFFEGSATMALPAARGHRLPFALPREVVAAKTGGGVFSLLVINHVC